jgi:cell division protein YceG involved in septum cleavage
MKSVISRSYNKNETLGTWMIMEGEKPLFSCKAIELPDNGNQKYFSCIPEGMYWMTKIQRLNGDNAFLLSDVPGRSEILVHKGNYAAGKKVDTEGCILPGAYFVDLNNDGNLDVAESTKTMEKLWNILPDKSQLYII